MTALLLALTLSQANPTFLGPYTKLGVQDSSTLLDGGSLLRGALIFATDGGVGEVSLYDGTYWNGIQSATTTPLTLYVDPTGSDANSCTATGTSACKTVNGALAKIPTNLRHAVTVNVAAGTYSESVSINGFRFQGAATLTVQGAAQVNSTLASGSATGTITTYTAAVPATATLGTLTDTGQAWTTGDLKGRFLTITSGAASGQQRIIVGNTATSLSLNSVVTGLAAGATYAIQEPSTIISGTVVVGGVAGGSTSASPIALNDLTVSTGSTASAVTVNDTRLNSAIQACRGVSLTRIRALSTQSSVTFSNSCGSASNVYGRGTGAAGTTLGVYGVPAYFADSSGYWTHAGSAANTNAVPVVVLGAVYAGGNANGFPVSESSGVASAFRAGTSYTAGPTSGTVSFFAFYALGGTGSCIFVTTAPVLLTSGFTCVGGTYGIDLDGVGGLVFGAGTSVSISGTLTADIRVDGTGYSLAYFNSLSPKSILGVYGSRITGR